MAPLLPEDHDAIEVVYGTEDTAPVDWHSPHRESAERASRHLDEVRGANESLSCEHCDGDDEPPCIENENDHDHNHDNNNGNDNKKKNKKLIAIVATMASIALAVAIAVPLASSPSSKQSSSLSSANDSNENKYEYKNDDTTIVPFAGDISEFMTSDRFSRQSIFRATDCPPGERLWKLNLVTDNYPWETRWELIRKESAVAVALDNTNTNNTNSNINTTNNTNFNTNTTTTILASGPPEGLNYARNTNYTGNLCLLPGTYHMRWFDRSSDGICCDYGLGHWEVSVDGIVVLENDPDGDGDDDNFAVRDFAFDVQDGSSSSLSEEEEEEEEEGNDNVNDDDDDDDDDGRIAGMYLGRRFPSAHMELKDGTIYRLLNLPLDFDYDGFVSGVTAITVSNETEFFSNGTADLKGLPPRRLEERHRRRRRRTFGREDASTRRRRRNLADFHATKSIVVVRVVASDGETSFDEAYLGDSVFGTGVDDGANVVSQMKACSYDKLIFRRAPDKVGFDNETTSSVSGANDTDIVTLSNGVVTITLPFTSVSQGDATMRNEITRRLNSVFGVKHPRQLADFAMYCLPENTMTGIAYAYMNSWLSVYSDRWCTYLSIQMHEIGHSLNFGHSNENGISYEDESGYMGFSYPNDDVPLMCYNAAKSWQTGWYDDKSITINVDGPFACFNGTLRGIADYPMATTVLLKIENGSGIDYFVNYNAKKGINMGTQDGANLVTVVSRPEGDRDSYAESELVAKLNVGENYTLPGFVVSVEDLDWNVGVARVIVLPDSWSNGTCDDANPLGLL